MRIKTAIIVSCIFCSCSIVQAEEETRYRGVYATFSQKNMASGSQGSGISHGVGWKKGVFGMEIYQTDMRTITNAMEQVWTPGGTRIGKNVITEKGFGFDFNFYVKPLQTRRLEFYLGPAMAFEKEAEVWKQGNALYANESTATWKTKFGGQGGLVTYLPLGDMNLSLAVGYSSYRGITTGVGVAF